MFNCPTVFVTETKFRHNGPVTTQLLMEYRGDSAGLSVGGCVMFVCVATLSPLMIGYGL